MQLNIRLNKKVSNFYINLLFQGYAPFLAKFLVPPPPPPTPQVTQFFEGPPPPIPLFNRGEGARGGSNYEYKYVYIHILI